MSVESERWSLSPWCELKIRLRAVAPCRQLQSTEAEEKRSVRVSSSRGFSFHQVTATHYSASTLMTHHPEAGYDRQRRPTSP